MDGVHRMPISRNSSFINRSKNWGLVTESFSAHRSSTVHHRFQSQLSSAAKLHFSTQASNARSCAYVVEDLIHQHRRLIATFRRKKLVCVVGCNFAGILTYGRLKSVHLRTRKINGSNTLTISVTNCEC